METKQVDEFHKHGCNFSGKLVVVDYQEEYANRKLKFYSFGAGDIFDYISRAENIVKEKQYKIKRVLLSIPEYVVEVE
jgi:hypothetical protein